MVYVVQRRLNFTQQDRVVFLQYSRGDEVAVVCVRIMPDDQPRRCRSPKSVNHGRKPSRSTLATRAIPCHDLFPTRSDPKKTSSPSLDVRIRDTSNLMDDKLSAFFIISDESREKSGLLFVEAATTLRTKISSDSLLSS